jgi:signal recognition particle subunit SRP54
VIDLSRRRRIAAGSGTSLDQVNRLISARKQMAKMMKQIGKGKVPALPGMPDGVGAMPQLPTQPAVAAKSGPARRHRSGSGKSRRKRRR